MKQIERVELISKIGRELQSRMTFSDIDVYLAGFNINVNQYTEGYNSKWVYVKDVLKDVNENVVLTIAEELEIEHSQLGADSKVTGNWKVNHFRLFISHLSRYKKKVTHLQKALYQYGISGFVAHKDIRPTAEWQDEIESSLLTMDALVAILTPRFNESNWTDHEVGAAIGRGKFVIPLDKGLKPYGFIAKYQTVPTKGKTVQQVATELFELLISNSKTKFRMTESLTNLAGSAPSIEKFTHYYELLKKIDTPASELIDSFRSNVEKIEYLLSDEDLLEDINNYLSGLGSTPIEIEAEVEDIADDIPF
ncbi:MAG: TIR domain-containing protein [Candidatus Pacebacteria bacterium]|nr:TIR domain-containing protein [Candidatus Paceibacterota bacterium]